MILSDIWVLYVPKYQMTLYAGWVPFTICNLMEDVYTEQAPQMMNLKKYI